MVNTTKDAGVPVESIEKNNINDLYFKEMLISPMELSTYDEGYLFDAVELKNLLEGYRASCLISMPTLFLISNCLS